MNDYTGAAFLLAIAAPIVSSIINLITQEIKHHRESRLLHKTEIIEDYVRYTGAYLRYEKNGNENYGAAYGKVLLYVPSEIAEKIIELNSMITPYIEKQNREKAAQLFDEICILLSMQIKKRKHKRKSKGYTYV